MRNPHRAGLPVLLQVGADGRHRDILGVPGPRAGPAPLHVLVAMSASLAFVTAPLSMVQAVPLLATVMSPLSPSETTAASADQRADLQQLR